MFVWLREVCAEKEAGAGGMAARGVAALLVPGQVENVGLGPASRTSVSGRLLAAPCPKRAGYQYANHPVDGNMTGFSVLQNSKNTSKMH